MNTTERAVRSDHEVNLIEQELAILRARVEKLEQENERLTRQLRQVQAAIEEPARDQ